MLWFELNSGSLKFYKPVRILAPFVPDYGCREQETKTENWCEKKIK